ncbi:MAG: hypothetical protein H0U18_06830 [Pyrinomonadaceae bacterium]|nr:hypothetical protein [Pyrinomonadaceae bacterium]
MANESSLTINTLTFPPAYFHVFLTGCASVLKVTLSKGKVFGDANSR